MSTTTAPERMSPDQQNQMQTLLQMISGYWVSQTIYAASKLGIPDLLSEGPRPIEFLAQSTQSNPDFLYRVLRALCSVGIFEELPGKTFQLTELGRPLQSDAPDSVRAISIMTGEEHYFAWGHLKQSLLTGQLPFEIAYGTGVFDYFKSHPEAGEAFNAAMTSMVKNVHAAAIPSYDFAAIKRLVDVGGGHGLLLSLILQRYPNMSGILFDLPHVASGATLHLREAQVEDRCEIACGNFFESVPSGADAYLLSHIIHDWNDESATLILRNVREAMNAESKLLLVEYLIKPGNASSMAKYMDLNMLVMTPGGRERTEAEYKALLDAAGLTLTRVIPTPSEHFIIEAIKQ